MSWRLLPYIGFIFEYFERKKADFFLSNSFHQNNKVCDGISEVRLAHLPYIIPEKSTKLSEPPFPSPKFAISKFESSGDSEQYSVTIVP